MLNKYTAHSVEKFLVFKKWAAGAVKSMIGIFENILQSSIKSRCIIKLKKVIWLH